MGGLRLLKEVDCSGVSLFRVLWGIALILLLRDTIMRNRVNETLHPYNAMHALSRSVQLQPDLQVGDVFSTWWAPNTTTYANPYQFEFTLQRTVEETMLTHTDLNSVTVSRSGGMGKSLQRAAWHSHDPFLPYLMPSFLHFFSYDWFQLNAHPLQFKAAIYLCYYGIYVVAIFGFIFPLHIGRRHKLGFLNWISANLAGSLRWLALVILLYFYWFRDISIYTGGMGIGGNPDMYLLSIYITFLFCLAPSRSLNYELCVNLTPCNIFRRILRLVTWRKAASSSDPERSYTVPYWVPFALRAQASICLFYSALSKLSSGYLTTGYPLNTWLTLDSLFPNLWYPYVAYPMPEWLAAALDPSNAVVFAQTQTAAEFIVALLLPFAGGFLLELLLSFSIFYHVTMFILFGNFFGPYNLVILFSLFSFIPNSWPRRYLHEVFRSSWSPPESSAESKKENVAAKEKPTEKQPQVDKRDKKESKSGCSKLTLAVVLCFLLLQILLPLRYQVDPAQSCWTSEGLAFSWAASTCDKWCVMEMNMKQGNETYQVDYLSYKIKDELRVPMVLGVPAFVVDLAHILRMQYFEENSFHRSISDGEHPVEAYANVQCQVNFGEFRALFDPQVDLLQETPNSIYNHVYRY